MELPVFPERGGLRVVLEALATLPEAGSLSVVITYSSLAVFLSVWQEEGRPRGYMTPVKDFARRSSYWVTAFFEAHGKHFVRFMGSETDVLLLRVLGFIPVQQIVGS